MGGKKMNIAWKELKKNKSRFFILGSIVSLISLLTFIISGLANGLSQDNASLIKNLPNGEFYMTKDADQTYSLSKINHTTQEKLLKTEKDALALSIQMGFLNDVDGKQRSVSFVTATDSKFFPEVSVGEIILDSSMKEKEIQVGDRLTNNQYSGEFIVKGFVEQSKYSHAPVAFINIKDYEEIYKVAEMQLIYMPEKVVSQDETNGLQSFSNKEFLNTISSYKAEQLTLNMIVWFLVVISGMLFAIFFYMMNVQKIGLFGILKAIGIKTSSLFYMMWTQMSFITFVALVVSITISHLLNVFAPKGMPYYLSMETTVILSIMFLFIGFMGATLSGIQIKKVEPLQAIQRGEG